MGTCEVYHSFASEPDINIDHNVSNFPATESSVCHLVISEPELTELPLPTYVCDLCGIKVKTKANLRAHQIKTHKIMKNAKDIAFYSKQRYNVSHIYHCPVTACKHNIALGGGFSTYWRLKQVNSSEPIINPSDGPVVFKPSLRNFPSFYTMSDTSLFSEASTQTEEAYTPMIVSQSYSQTHAFQTHELVSVNTCTDEDDISFFIGGLFCNASVEANFLQPNTINDNSEVKEEGNLLNETKQVTLGSIKERQSSLLGNPIENSVQMSDYTSLTGCLNSGVDQEIQARLLPLRENAAMQTDVVEKFNAEVATHCPHVDRSTYFTPSRMLETPPPPMLQSTVSLGTHLSTACQTFHGLLNDAKISEKQPSQTFNVNTTIDSSTHTSANLLNYSSYDLPTSTDSILRCSSSSIKTSAQNSTIPTSCNNSQYDSLNSIVTTTQHYWLPSMDFTHNETQTIDEDIELWLNSVETQTNLALFDPSFFSDICVGVDDNFFHS
ncbi:ATM interactor [Schistosoma japonicum]|nr:ATM interactor [Schistosoma japonicum]